MIAALYYNYFFFLFYLVFLHLFFFFIFTSSLSLSLSRQSSPLSCVQAIALSSLSTHGGPNCLALDLDLHLLLLQAWHVGLNISEQQFFGVELGVREGKVLKWAKGVR